MTGANRTATECGHTYQGSKKGRARKYCFNCNPAQKVQCNAYRDGRPVPVILVDWRLAPHPWEPCKNSENMRYRYGPGEILVMWIKGGYFSCTAIGPGRTTSHRDSNIQALPKNLEHAVGWAHDRWKTIEESFVAY